MWIPLTLRIQGLSGSGVAVAGLVVDRRDARGVLLVASVAQMAVAAALVLAIDSVGAIIALPALRGTGFAFAQPAEFSLVPVVAGGRAMLAIAGGVSVLVALAGLVLYRRPAPAKGPQPELVA